MKTPPIQYQRGWVEFYKLKFKVTPKVLIPRPETELLVDEIIKYASNVSNKKNGITILDIGTGSGNIAISLAKNLDYPGNIEIIASDRSSSALNIAKQNAEFHNLLHKIEFVKSDLLKNVKIYSQNPNSKLLIVTNLPYIPSYRIPYLDSSVKDFEPHIALDGGDDGFDLYRNLFSQIKKGEYNFDLLVGEIDYTQSEIALAEANIFFPKFKSSILTDLNHKQRILLVQNK